MESTENKLSDEMVRLQQENKKLREENEALQKRINEMETFETMQAGQLELEVESLRQENDHLHDRLFDLEMQVDELQEDNQHLNIELSESGAGVHHTDCEGPFVASKQKTHFHRPNCEWAKYIFQAPHLLIEFSSHREAIEANYKPCKTCRA